jgi:hypothetical protein
MRFAGLAAAVLLAPLTAAAQTAAPAPLPGSAWTATPTSISVAAARIVLPVKAGTASLTKTAEFSRAGEGVDNYAQFETPDGKVFVTAYVYRAAYADAALAAFATDEAVRSRFGAEVRAVERGSVAAAGQPSGAIRVVYDGAVLNGGALTTAAAFLRVDSWIVKLRASGPAARRAEVVAALDALVAGVSVTGDATVYAVRPLEVTGPCPGASGKDAKVVTGKDSTGMALFGALMGGSVLPTKGKDGTARTIAFPANGATPACVRGTLGGGRITMLQPAGEAEPGIMLAPFNDAGGVLAVEGSLLGAGYTVKRYGVAEVVTGASLDRMPRPSQVDGWMRSKASPLDGRTRTVFKANGNTTINVDPSVLK